MIYTTLTLCWMPASETRSVSSGKGGCAAPRDGLSPCPQPPCPCPASQAAPACGTFAGQILGREFLGVPPLAGSAQWDTVSGDPLLSPPWLLLGMGSLRVRETHKAKTVIKMIK